MIENIIGGIFLMVAGVYLESKVTTSEAIGIGVLIIVGTRLLWM